MAKLTLQDFEQIYIEGTSLFYLAYRLLDGETICLEPCFLGLCVARYDAKKQIVGEKVCTNLRTDTVESIEKALELANKLL